MSTHSYSVPDANPNTCFPAAEHSSSDLRDAEHGRATGSTLQSLPGPGDGVTGMDALQGTFKNPTVPSESDVFIAVMGMTGTGKTTFISHCTNEEVEIIGGPGVLESCECPKSPTVPWEAM